MRDNKEILKNIIFDTELFKEFGFSIQNMIDIRDTILFYLCNTSLDTIVDLKSISDFIYVIDVTIENQFIDLLKKSSSDMPIIENK